MTSAGLDMTPDLKPGRHPNRLFIARTREAAYRRAGMIHSKYEGCCPGDAPDSRAGPT